MFTNCKEEKEMPDPRKTTSPSIPKEVKNLKEDAATLAEAISSATADKAEKLKKKGNNMLENMEGNAYKAGLRIRDSVEEAEERVKEGVDYLENKIKNHPFVSTAIALGLGLLIGGSFRR